MLEIIQQVYLLNIFFQWPNSQVSSYNPPAFKIYSVCNQFPIETLPIILKETTWILLLVLFLQSCTKKGMKLFTYTIFWIFVFWPQLVWFAIAQRQSGKSSSDRISLQIIFPRMGIAVFTASNLGKGVPLQRLEIAQAALLITFLELVLSTSFISLAIPPFCKILSLYFIQSPPIFPKAQMACQLSLLSFSSSSPSSASIAFLSMST